MVERQIAETQARLQAAFWNLPFDFWICDQSGRYVFENKRSQEMWGPQVGNLSPNERASPELREHWRVNNARAFAGEVVRNQLWMEVGGARRFVEEIIAPIVVEGQIRGILGTNIDLTQRQRSAQLLAGQQRVLQRIAAGAPLLETLEALIASIQEQMPEATCSLMRVDAGTRRLFRWAGGQLPEEYVSAIEGTPVQEGAGSCGTAAFRRQRVISADIVNDPTWSAVADLARRHNLRACVSEPVLARHGEVLGTFAVYFHEPRAPGPEHLQLLKAAVDLAAIAVERSVEAETLRKSATDLRLANQAKDRFLATLSHELRTPLTPVLASASALVSDSQLPARLRDELELIRRNAEAEARLIDELLDLTQLTRAQGAAAPAPPVDLGALLRESADALPTGAVAVHWDLPAEAAIVRAEPRRLGQALRSLLRFAVQRAAGSAVKSVEVGVSATNDASTGRARWRLRIRDHGAVAAGTALDTLFDLFAPPPEGPGGPEARRLVGGAGVEGGGVLEIGLALARALIEANGGTVQARSLQDPQGGQGIVLEVELAAGAAPVPPPARGAAILRGRGGGTLRILLVEDHTDTQRVLGQLLRRQGFHVVCAGTVDEARGALARGPIDLLITDIGLPDGSGLGVVKLAQETGPIPAIALSGYGTPEDIDAMRAAGCTTYLVKPVRIEKLEQAIAEVLAAPT